MAQSQSQSQSQQLFDYRNSVSEIIPGRLSLSGIYPTYRHEDMAKFTHVLTVLSDDHLTPEMCAGGKIRRRISALDKDSESLPLFDACKWIDTALSSQPNTHILVHCYAGMSRSPTIVIAYLMWSETIDFDTAYDRVFKARPCLEINDGFVDQLKRWTLTKFN